MLTQTLKEAKAEFIMALEYINDDGRRPRLENLLMKRFNRLGGQPSYLDAIYTELRFVGSKVAENAVLNSLNDLVENGVVIKTYKHRAGPIEQWSLATGKVTT